MKPIAVDREHSLFTSRLHLGKHLAVVARLMQSAYMNEYDAYAYRRDLMPHPPPLHRADQIGEFVAAPLAVDLKTTTEAAACYGQVGISARIQPMRQTSRRIRVI